MSLRHTIKTHTPWPLHYIYRKIYYAPQDVPAAFGFLFHATKSPTTFLERLRLVGAFYKISYFVDCPHTEHELIVISRAILNLGQQIRGSIVEAGAFHGGSTAKLSLVARLARRNLEVFDSFAGMPENTEVHGKSIYGRDHRFPKGSHAVGLAEVRGNVERFGDIGRTNFHKGFFSDTMPGFASAARAAKTPVAAACVNVDLVQSTKDCCHYLYPLLSPGGVIFSQDAHFPWIIELFESDAFWQNEVGIAKPEIEGLGRLKFVGIWKA
jgi:O-methyltransferase